MGKKYNHPPIAWPLASQRACFARTWGGEIKHKIDEKVFLIATPPHFLVLNKPVSNEGHTFSFDNKCTTGFAKMLHGVRQPIKSGA